MMSQSSKDELIAELRPRYRQASRGEKKQILDELVAVTGYHRKYVIQVLNHPPKRRKRKKRTSQTKYQGPVRAALEQVWRTANCICGKRLAPVLPQYIEALERFGELTLDDTTREQLLTISPATVDRLLKRARERTKPHGLGTTKPGTLLKHTIPIRTSLPSGMMLNLASWRSIWWPIVAKPPAVNTSTAWTWSMCVPVGWSWRP